MRRSLALALAVVVLAAALCAAELAPAIFAIGFGVGVPYQLPVAWDQSFSYLTSELFLSRNLTAAFDLGVYPSSFPDLIEASASLLVKGWLGSSSLFAGGGLAARYLRIGSVWGISPYLILKAGFQTWLLDSLALVVQYRTMESLPIDWDFSPELSFGVTVAFGRARPETPVYDGQSIWVLLGLGVAALIAFLPRQ
ncbi:hypothetical protein KJ567_05520 [Candidatus Bipolaricaulota bacterium]|nr:hypothetical protein [Candidatus Bipolaricaulota bacterium]